MQPLKDFSVNCSVRKIPAQKTFNATPEGLTRFRGAREQAKFNICKQMDPEFCDGKHLAARNVNKAQGKQGRGQAIQL